MIGPVVVCQPLLGLNATLDEIQFLQIQFSTITRMDQRQQDIPAETRFGFHRWSNLVENSYWEYNATLWNNKGEVMLNYGRVYFDCTCSSETHSDKATSVH